MSVRAQIESHLEQIRRHTSAIEELLPKLDKGSAGASAETSSAGRNPAWFRPSGKLSDAGIAYIYGLYDKGTPVEGAAMALGISLSGAAARYRSWKQQRSV